MNIAGSCKVANIDACRVQGPREGVGEGNEGIPEERFRVKSNH